MGAGSAHNLEVSCTTPNLKPKNELFIMSKSTSNVTNFPKRNAILHTLCDSSGAVLTSAASRITPIIGSEPMHYCLDLASPGSRADSNVNQGVLTGTSEDLLRIKDVLHEINSGLTDTEASSSYISIEVESLDIVISRHTSMPMWLIQIKNGAGRIWFRYSFCDQTALEIAGAIDNYKFTPYKWVFYRKSLYKYSTRIS